MKCSFYKVITASAIAIALLGNVACSSSSDSTTDAATATTEDNATAVAQSSINLATSMAGVVNPSLSSTYFSNKLSASIYTTDSASLDCGDGTTGSGTLDYSYDTDTGDFTFTANSCDFGDGSGVIDGSFSLSTTDNTTTMAFEEFSVTTDEGVFTLDGSMTLTIGETTGDVTIAYDAFTATDSTDSTYSFSLSGTLTYSATDGTLTGDITVTDGTTSVTCSFTDFDTTTATDSEWASACSIL